MSAASVYGTLGELRDLTDDLPDDTLIEVNVRKAHDPDNFYEPVLAESCISIHMHGKPVLSLDVPEPKDVGL